MTVTATGRVRPFREDDMPQVADLHQRVFGGGTGSTPPALKSYLEEIFCRSPWHDEALPSLVYEDDRGRIAGCLGVMPRPMWMNGCRIRAAVSHSFMVDAASRSTLAAVQLVKAYFTGPQDIALADANRLSQHMWGLAGGATPILYRIRWTRALQPARHALSWLRKRGVGGRAVAGLRPLGWAADALVTRLASSPFRQKKPLLAGEELDGRALADCLTEFSRSRALRPECDNRAAAWLLAMLGRKTGLGTLRKVLVRDATGRVAGWYVYYLKRGDIAEVVQFGGRDDSISGVLDHLFHDAWQGGAVAVSGQVDPAYMQALSDAHCMFRLDRNSGGVRLHSRREDVLQTILRGDAFLTRLESEWWIPF